MNAQLNGTVTSQRPARKPQPKQKPRKIFARLRVVVDGIEYRVEMRVEAVAVKRLHARGGWHEVALADLVTEAMGQKTFRLTT